MVPNAVSKLAARAMAPCCVQMQAPCLVMSSRVACASSEPPGTIQGTTPMPRGKTMMPSVMQRHSVRVQTRASGSSSVESAITFGQCA